MATSNVVTLCLTRAGAYFVSYQSHILLEQSVVLIACAAGLPRDVFNFYMYYGTLGTFIEHCGYEVCASLFLAAESCRAVRRQPKTNPFILNTFTVATSAHPRARGALAPTLPPGVGRPFGGRTAVRGSDGRSGARQAEGFSPGAAAYGFFLFFNFVNNFFPSKADMRSGFAHKLNSPTLDISHLRFDPHVRLECASPLYFPLDVFFFP